MDETADHEVYDFQVETFVHLEVPQPMPVFFLQ